MKKSARLRNLISFVIFPEGLKFSATFRSEAEEKFKVNLKSVHQKSEAIHLDKELKGSFPKPLNISIDILIVMATQKLENPYVRSPTLDTVLMVEKIIDKFSGEYNRTEMWKRLPKKVMWQTFLVILEYLESINKIAFDKKGTIAYIWNPELAKKLRLRKEIKI